MNATDLSYTPALELGRLYRAKKLSPVEVTDAVLARIERLNPKLNAYLTVTADHARELARAAEARFARGEARGALDGIPYSIKDLEPTAGIRTTYGSKFFEHNVPTEDGAVASRLRAVRRHAARQDQHASLRLQGHVRQPDRAALPEPLEPRPHVGRLLGRGGIRGGGRARARSPTAPTAPARSASRRRSAGSSDSSPRSGGCLTGRAPTSGPRARTTAR